MISVVCSQWFVIPGEYTPRREILYVAPYVDIYGFFLDKAKTVLGYHEAGASLTMQTWLYPGLETSLWSLIGYDGNTIDEPLMFLNILVILHKHIASRKSHG